MAFDYSIGVHIRRHGPVGYDDYVSYKEWLRDEFCFRCVYCLKRELWGILLGSFQIDHFIAQSVSPELSFTYDNLIYSCARCNLLKSDVALPDPCVVAYGQCIRVNTLSGEVEPLNDNGELLSDLLNLNDREMVRFRKLLIDTFSSLAVQDKQDLLRRWLGFPDDLPDLASKKPRSNTRPNGIQYSYFAQRARGELPASY